MNRLFVLTCSLLSTLAVAAPGRYVVTAPVATAQQRDLLSVVTQIRFHSDVVTIGDAVDTLLAPSGYTLAPGTRHSALLELPLPAVHRELGPITLEHAIKTLAGAPWETVYDPVHRLVAYELRPEYQTVASSHVPPFTHPVLTESSQSTLSVEPVRVSEIESPKSPGASVVKDATETRFLFPKTPTVKTQLPEETEYLQEYFAALDENISLDIRDLALKPALEKILPGWRIDVFLSDPTIANGKLDLSASDTRENILFTIENRLGVRFFPYTDRTPPVLVVTDTSAP